MTIRRAALNGSNRIGQEQDLCVCVCPRKQDGNRMCVHACVCVPVCVLLDKIV